MTVGELEGDSLRFYMLSIYCLLSCTNSAMWTTFAPIEDLSQQFFDVNETQIAFLALIWSIMYGPGSVLGIYCYKVSTLKLRQTLLLGGVLTVSGSFIRIIAVYFRSQLTSQGSYFITLLGMLICGLAQPIFVNVATALCSTWFPLEERDRTTTVAAIFNPLGNAIGQILPPLLVYKSNNDDDNTNIIDNNDEDDDYSNIKGMLNLMIVQFLMSFIPFLLCYISFRTAPVHPPSASELYRSGYGYNSAVNSIAYSNGGALLGSDGLENSQGVGSLIAGDKYVNKHVKTHANLYNNNNNNIVEEGEYDNNNNDNRLGSRSKSYDIENDNNNNNNDTLSPLPHEHSRDNYDGKLNTHVGRSSWMGGMKSQVSTDVSRLSVLSSVTNTQLEVWESMYEMLRTLLHNEHYILLMLSFSIGLGMINAFETLVFEIVDPYGYSNSDAGLFGAVLIIAGIVGSMGVGTLLEHTRAYRTVYSYGFLLCFMFTILFTVMLYRDNFVGLLISFCCLGLTTVPLFPVCLENTAECVYPLSEDIAIGILLTIGNISTVIVTLCLQSTLSLPSWGPPPFSPSNFFILIILLLAVIIAFQYKGDYRRLKVDLQHEHDVLHGLHGQGTTQHIYNDYDGSDDDNNGEEGDIGGNVKVMWSNNNNSNNNNDNNNDNSNDN